MGADIGRPPIPMFPWFDHVFSFQHVIYRRQRSKELTRLMSMDEDMTYRLADKLRCPGSGFNSIAFVRKRLVPCGSWSYLPWIYPPAKFPGSNPENLAGPFLGKAL